MFGDKTQPEHTFDKWVLKGNTLRIECDVYENMLMLI